MDAVVDYEKRISEVAPKVRYPLAQRITLAVIDAAYKGELDPALSQRIIDYVDTPYAYYEGEPQYSLFDRIITNTAQLYTVSGLRNMLNVVKMAGGYISTQHYGCLAPKGVKYGHIKTTDAMSILTREYYRNKSEDYEIKKVVNHDYEEHLRTSDYAIEELESYRKVRDH